MKKLAALSLIALLMTGCGTTGVGPMAASHAPHGVNASAKKKTTGPSQGLFSKVVDRKFAAVSETAYAVSGVRRISVKYVEVVKKTFGGTKEESAELWLDYLSGDSLTHAYRNGTRLENNDDTYAIAQFLAKVADELKEGDDKKLMTKAAAGLLTYR